MIHYNIFLHFSVIQYMPDLAIGSKFFQIMFEFFLPKKSLQNWQKKSIFSGAIGDHILGFWTQCKKSQLSRSSRSRKSFFWMTLYQLKGGWSKPLNEPKDRPQWALFWSRVMSWMLTPFSPSLFRIRLTLSKCPHVIFFIYKHSQWNFSNINTQSIHTII